MSADYNIRLIWALGDEIGTITVPTRASSEELAIQIAMRPVSLVDHGIPPGAEICPE